MLYRILADGVMVVHFAFILFVVVGAVLAWRWPAVLWVHVPALAWGVGTVAIGFPCPLTTLENGLRRVAGDAGYGGGFVDRYIEDVIYPDEYTILLRGLAALAIAGSYVAVLRRARSAHTAPASRYGG
jgi:hypothetical protein